MLCINRNCRLLVFTVQNIFGTFLQHIALLQQRVQTESISQSVVVWSDDTLSSVLPSALSEPED